MRNIIIRPALNGYILEVGCQRVVFETRGKMLDELGRYLDDPKGVEKDYIQNAVNKIPDGPCEPTIPPATVAMEGWGNSGLTSPGIAQGLAGQQAYQPDRRPA